MKRLIVGDIHGCYAEFQALLDQAGLADDDEIIALGDLVDRGPDSPRVVDFFQNHPRARSLMGNHEWKHVQIRRGQAEPAPSQTLAREQFTTERYAYALRWFEELPTSIGLPEALLIHGCFDPTSSLAGQRPDTLLGTMSAEAYLRRHYPHPWFELYQGPRPLVAGHHDYSKVGKPLVIRDKVFLIDTGCCYGRALTGLLLPDFRLLSVPSRRNYWGLAVQRHGLKGKKPPADQGIDSASIRE
jgi:serine/threonine protein phosphatase 1